LADYQARLAELEALDVGVAGLCVDEAARSRRVRRQLGLTFPLLGDPSRQTIQAWGLRDREDWRDLAFPATILVERDGTLGMISVERTRRRLEPGWVLERLRAGSSEPPPPPRFVRAWPIYWMRVVANVGRHGMKMRHPPPPGGG